MTKPDPSAWIDPLGRPVLAASIPATGLAFTVTPDAAEREALARALDLVSVDRLTADFQLRAAAGGLYEVSGMLRAEVRPRCVVTLEPFSLVIDEPVSIRFADAAAPAARRAATPAPADLDDDPPDPVENGMIDLGRVTTEFLSLALPIYPRAPGAEFAASGEDGPASPFAVLAGKGRAER
ncbi:MAG TPA: YceD family protein [Beijerinckiaceae bacterium]|nr:YceD family protein [Beijerinckiaceae bacterium]